MKSNEALDKRIAEIFYQVGCDTASPGMTIEEGIQAIKQVIAEALPKEEEYKGDSQSQWRDSDIYNQCLTDIKQRLGL